MRYSGRIGFTESYEKSPGIWAERITERPYYGDVVKNYKRNNENGKINDDVLMDNQFSVIADRFAYNHVGHMKYITHMGFKWRISGIDASQYPRLTISVGGLYDE